MSIEVEQKGALINIRVMLMIITSFCFIVGEAVSTQSAELFENRFYSSTITPSDDSNLQEALFYDTDDNFIVQGLPLINVISLAYEISRFQIVEGPDWIHASHLYDIKAVPPPSFVNSDNGQMLVNLLADRFGLVMEKTSRKMNGLAFVVENQNFEFLSNDSNKGIKFMRTMPELGVNNIKLEFTFDALAERLSRELDQAVLNQTGLVGTYVAELDGVPSNGPRLEILPIAERMGIKLELREVEVDVVEITNIEHPAVD